MSRNKLKDALMIQPANGNHRKEEAECRAQFAAKAAPTLLFGIVGETPGVRARALTPQAAVLFGIVGAVFKTGV